MLSQIFAQPNWFNWIAPFVMAAIFGGQHLFRPSPAQSHFAGSHNAFALTVALDSFLIFAPLSWWLLPLADRLLHVPGASLTAAAVSFVLYFIVTFGLYRLARYFPVGGELLQCLDRARSEARREVSDGEAAGTS